MKRKIEIFVSGSTNPNISKEYDEAAKEFGKMLDVQKHNIIFDGCDGLPGIVASKFKDSKDNLSIAVTSNHQIKYGEWPLARVNGTFQNQSEVTKALLDWSDVSVFFKGGSGTLAELFHAIDTKKNGEHKKPILIINIQHQWDDLIKLLDSLQLKNIYNVMDTPKEALEYIEKHIKINEMNYMAQYDYDEEDYER